MRRVIHGWRVLGTDQCARNQSKVKKSIDVIDGMEQIRKLLTDIDRHRARIKSVLINDIKFVLINDIMHELIEANGVDAVEKFIIGKRAITTYSNQIIEMHGLDSKLGLDSTIDCYKGTISYRDYYLGKKEDREECLVIHNKYERGTKQVRDISHFLPQLLPVIVPVECHDDNTKSQLRRRSHPCAKEVIRKSLEINEYLKRSKNCIFTTDDKSISVNGYFIAPPNICFKSFEPFSHALSPLSYFKVFT